MLRFFFRLFRKLAWWQQLGALCAVPVLSLNLTVAFVGSSVVNPISPFFMKEKWAALQKYVAHRPLCVLTGHDDFQQIISRAERDAELPRGLMRAVVDVESAGKPHRISYAGAMGPAQLMPGTAAMLKVSDPFDPQESITAGARYLKQLLERNGGNVELAVAAYNAGPNNVNGAVPRNGQTEFYVERVLKRFRARD